MRVAANGEGGERRHTFGEAVGAAESGGGFGAPAAAAERPNAGSAALQRRGMDVGGGGRWCGGNFAEAVLIWEGTG
jgi:hypothetical protein